jgi:hypothetical protein
MKLSQKALGKLKDKRLRMKLCVALNCTERTILRYIEDNDDNLTKAAALTVIREETKLTDEEILEGVAVD